jgi:hypothetical protein
MKFKPPFLAIMFMLVCVSSSAMETDTKTPESLVIVMGSPNPAYTVILTIPESIKNNFETDEITKKFKFSSIPIQDFKSNPEKYLKASISVSSYSTENFYNRFADLVTEYQNTPIGLVFNGGVAITANDYTHAARIYAIWKKDEASYLKMQSMPENQKWDPINPDAHFVPLLGK